MNNSYVWPLVNRISHILLIVFLATSYILGDYKKLLDYHIAFGVALGVTFAFRFIWGYIGPRYSKFKDFDFSIDDLKDYMLDVLSHLLHVGKKSKEYIGHNPASSFAIVSMIALTFLAIFTGFLAQGIEKNHGIFAFLHSDYFKQMELFSGLHSFFANALIFVIAAHVAGSLIDKFIKKSDAIDSMVSGFKRTKELFRIRLNIFQVLFSFIWIAVSLFSLYYMLFTKNNVLLASANVKQNYTLMHKDFSKECSDCHTLYPPYLLPGKSWTLMMSNLDNHFGEDASLDMVTNHSILAFLKKNSAETSTQEAAFKINKELKNNDKIIAITKTNFWKNRHKNIDKKLFLSKEVKSKANCKACHQNIQKGLLDYEFIRRG
ncbi:MAG: cytochrome b/b6 domain-containing protein [Campylobacteraceae bacterium]|nr:cytochrome b/b6 domain-containing protein [Campylobacteraceae bacterium]